MEKQKKIKKEVYWNPYFGGFLLGLVLILVFYISGRGIGATGGLKGTVIATVDAVSPTHAQDSPYYAKFLEDEKSPLNSWLGYETLGVIIGAFISGAVSGRLKLKVEHSPKITSRRRLVFALIGGVLFGFGSQVARGCTSGAALSGMAVLATGGFVTMLSIFGTGYVVAYFFRKNWI